MRVKKVSLAKKKKQIKKQRQIGPWGYISAKGQMPKPDEVKNKKNSSAEIGRDLWWYIRFVLECLLARSGEDLADEALS